jgi:peptidoglycan/xylan/chitin deacetylase (PgdA/CDA1 family)
MPPPLAPPPPPPAPPPPARLELAVTIDDLPFAGDVAPGETRLEAGTRLLEVLARHRVPATGFVICDNVRPGEPLLERWLARGHELGNHTASHPDLNRSEPSAWLADAERCHGELTRWLGRAPRYFRYPMLHEGATPERRDQARALLERLGYQNAVVTIDNSEYRLAAYYAAARQRGDAACAKLGADEYARHLGDALEHFDRAARDAIGAPIPQILLLHANLLAADQLERVLTDYEARGVRFISLEAALRHPVFAAQPSYVGPKGLSWIYRVSDSARQRWGSWDDEQAARIESVLAHAQCSDRASAASVPSAHGSG